MSPSPSARRPRWRDDAGFVTALAVGLVPILLLLGGVVSAATAVAATRHSAEGAADLAALAAAGHVLAGEPAACAAADHVAEANGGQLVACHLQGLEVLVTVARRLPGGLGRLGEVRGTARAGRR